MTGLGHRHNMVLRRVTQCGKPRRGHSLIFVSMAPRVLENLQKSGHELSIGSRLRNSDAGGEFRGETPRSAGLLGAPDQRPLARGPQPLSERAQEGAFES